jgi:multiple sugar transport system substrate-binding protein
LASAIVGGAAGCLGDGDGNGNGNGNGNGDFSDVQVSGEDAATRALNAAQELGEGGETINALVPTAAESNFDAVKGRWEDETDTTVEVETVPDANVYSETMNEAVNNSDQYDIFIVTPRNIPDFTEAGLSLDLTERAEHFQPTLTGEDGIIPPFDLQTMYKERIRLFMAAGDVMHLHVRKPWLENEEFQTQYEDRFGEQLKAPETIEELDRQIQFFGEMDDRSGAFFYMGPYWSKWTFRRRFIKKGELLWDDEFSPNFNNDTGVEVLEELKSLMPYMTDNVTSAGVDEHYQTFASGDVYCTYGWPSMSRFISDPETSDIPSADEWMIVRDPGTEVDGQEFRPVQFTWGWGFMVNQMSQMSDLAYLYSQWMYSPSVSADVTKEGYLDPWRKNHLRDAETMRRFYSTGEGDDDVWQDYVDTYEWNINHSYPELIMQGVEEYYEAIDTAVSNVLVNDADPEEQLNQAAEQCESITEQYGRDSQIEQWEFLKSTYAEPIRDVLGLPDPPQFIEDV